MKQGVDSEHRERRRRADGHFAPQRGVPAIKDEEMHREEHEPDEGDFLGAQSRASMSRGGEQARTRPLPGSDPAPDARQASSHASRAKKLPRLSARPEM